MKLFSLATLKCKDRKTDFPINEKPYFSSTIAANEKLSATIFFSQPAKK